MKKHLKIVSIVSVAALSVASAQAENKTYDLSGFTRVAAAEGVNVEVNVGGGFSVEASGSAQSLEVLELKLSGSTLSVSRKGRSFNNRWSGGRAPVVRVTMPSMDQAEVSSGADLNARGIDAGDFSASVSSGGDLYLEGRCDSLDADVSSGADLNAGEFHCRDVKIDISTGAGASVYASNSIDASASTGGDVTVSGSPAEKHVSKSLGGDVSIK